MAIPTIFAPPEDGRVVAAPTTRYRVTSIPEGQVALISEEMDSLLDPRVVLSAQLSHTLSVRIGREFDTNMPKLVNDDFLCRAQQWKDYLDNGAWRRLNQCDKVPAQQTAASIHQHYRTLYKLGKEERCTFGLENILLNLQDLIRLEGFFSTLGH